MLYQAEERARRLQIVIEGKKTEFWKILSESLAYWIFEKSKEVVTLHSERKHEEAKELSNEIMAVQRLLSEPERIIRYNKPLAEKFGWFKKIKETIS